MSTQHPAPPPGSNANTLDTASAWARETGTTLVRNYHRYGQWLISISWWRYVMWAFVWLLLAALSHELPPMRWHWPSASADHVMMPPIRLKELPQVKVNVNRIPLPAMTPDEVAEQAARAASAGEEAASATAQAASAASKAAASAAASSTVKHAPADAPAASGPAKADVGMSIDKGGIRIRGTDNDGKPVDVRIGREGVHINGQRTGDAPGAHTDAAGGLDDGVTVARKGKEITVDIDVPADVNALELQDAIMEATDAANAMVRDALADEAYALQQQLYESLPDRGPTLGDTLMQLVVLWIAASAVLKFVYRGQVQAEVKAAQATETAEAESLRRQVVEARMAAMQAQVEPHFLFNTLASIDHLIETDAPRASQMQKHLIALLRASMPRMRETMDASAKDLRRELALVKPYVEILKMRMDERLDAQIDVPEGLMSAEFPPLMMQTLVENAIRHGLEPKPEGGQLRVSAQVADGKLQVTVADTGVGFGQSRVSGTGLGLANIRERLQMSYGSAASVTITANQPSGTVVTLTLPYRTVSAAA